jgi:hypothetical protein
MPTELTNPITQTITHVTLDGWELVVHRNADLTVNVNHSYLIADVGFRDADGKVIRRQRFNQPGDALPPEVQGAIVGLQTALLNYAKAAGVVPPGSDTPDF